MMKNCLDVNKAKDMLYTSQGRKGTTEGNNCIRHQEIK